MDDYLASVYYDPKRSGGFGGVDRLYKDVKKEGKFNINRTKIKEWLMKQDAYTLHKPIRRHFKRRVIVGGIGQQWQMDLADMYRRCTEDYVDLSKTILVVRAKVTKANGNDLDANEKVGIVNNFLHSLFKQVDVFLKEKQVTQATGTRLTKKVESSKWQDRYSATCLRVNGSC